MIKIGVVNIDTSHPLEFALELQKENRARYTAVFNGGFRGEGEVNAFADKFGLERICNSIEELADIVDVGFIQGCNWDKHLEYAMAFIERGKPVFIDKPMVGNIADCRTLMELEEKGAEILGSSSLRYCNEIKNFLNLSESERGNVIHVDVTVGVDEFNYAIHGAEAMCAVANSKPVSVKYVGASHTDNLICDTYFTEFESGATGCYHCLLGKNTEFNVMIITTTSSFCFKIDSSALYKSLLDQICNKLEGKLHCLSGMEELTDSIKVLLSGKCSKEKGGKSVDINSPELESVCFDGNAFEKEYALKSKSVYL